MAIRVLDSSGRCCGAGITAGAARRRRRGNDGDGGFGGVLGKVVHRGHWRDVVLRVLIPVRTSELGDRLDWPAVRLHERVGIDEVGDIVCGDFVLQNDQAWILRARKDLIHAGLDSVERDARLGANIPVVAVIIPNDSRQAKDFLGNGADTIVGIAVRGAPESWYTAARRIVDNLHAPTKLRENLFIGKGRHVGVAPCVHGNMIYRAMSTWARAETSVITHFANR